MLAEQGNVWAEKSIKTPQTVNIIESFSNQIRKDSLLMIFDEFDICYGAANICSKKVLGIEPE